MITPFLLGANMLGFALAGLFFLRFWKKTGDRLFLIFAGAFWGLSLDRLILAALHSHSEIHPSVYLVRLLSFVLIIVAIVDKNRSGSA